MANYECMQMVKAGGAICQAGVLLMVLFKHLIKLCRVPGAGFV